MNEEQLKEIALLVEELGFNSNSFCNNHVFIDLLESKNSIALDDIGFYLLLCEIQLWLLGTPDIHVEILRYTDNTFSAQLCGDRFPHAYDDKNAPFEAFNCKSLPDALAIAILKALKLIKNENN